ncbi:class I SAM-dependent methyltransferase [Leifsonia sp. NPDC077715]|uniref:class I SAM-dependent methyltransferase n=1 Tax=Leifsonia sp. NPDC077715 TaxID=3155539 RepID=UPI00343B462C
MTESIEIPGAVVPPRPGVTAEEFDAAHGDAAADTIMARLAREAYGDDYPDGVDPYGMSTRWTLQTFVSQLDVPEGGTLVDIACGRAGVSLWVARETGADLIGVDWSPVAVAEAAKRASQWVDEGRARFQIGDLVATGLPDECADAVLCADAIFFATDRIAAVREAARILRPGGRYAFTAHESDDGRPHAVPDWRPIIEAGGLEVVARIEIPRWAEQLGRMYDVWMANLDEVRQTLGEEAANAMREEAETVGPTLPNRTGVLYVAQRA